MPLPNRHQSNEKLINIRRGEDGGAGTGGLHGRPPWFAYRRWLVAEWPARPPRASLPGKERHDIYYKQIFAELLSDRI